jgi:hypothetical protein
LLQAGQHTLNLKLSVREIEAIREVLATPANLPCVHINIKLSVSMSRPNGIHGNLENFPGQRLPELESLQVRVDGAKATFHTFLDSPEFEKRGRKDTVSVHESAGGGPKSRPCPVPFRFFSQRRS